MSHIQCDIRKYNGKFTEVPRNVPGRLGYDDFISFIYPKSLDATKYDVALESLDVAGPRYRLIGKLQTNMQIPSVWFGWNAKVLVLPKDEKDASFVSELRGGAEYILQDPKKPGMYKMIRRTSTYE
jgi:hypothetical protein